jgi:REP element-mobilizing transposase RayT
MENKLIHLSPNGIIAMEQWNWLGNQYPYIDFKWQKSYYDHIVRDDESLIRIKKYIENNPAKWNKQKNGMQI